MSRLEFHPLLVNTCSADEEGRLIVVDGRLVGVLVQLQADEQATRRGQWNLEAGFGPLAGYAPEPFGDLEEARRWITRALSD